MMADYAKFAKSHPLSALIGPPVGVKRPPEDDLLPAQPKRQAALAESLPDLSPMLSRPSRDKARDASGLQDVPAARAVDRAGPAGDPFSDMAHLPLDQPSQEPSTATWLSGSHASGSWGATVRVRVGDHTTSTFRVYSNTFMEGKTSATQSFGQPAQPGIHSHASLLSDATAAGPKPPSAPAATPAQQSEPQVSRAKLPPSHPGLAAQQRSPQEDRKPSPGPLAHLEAARAADLAPPEAGRAAEPAGSSRAEQQQQQQQQQQGSPESLGDVQPLEHLSSVHAQRVGAPGMQELRPLQQQARPLKQELPGRAHFVLPGRESSNRVKERGVDQARPSPQLASAPEQVYRQAAAEAQRPAPQRPHAGQKLQQEESYLHRPSPGLPASLLAQQQQIWLQYDGPTLGRPAGRGSFPEDLVQLLAQHPDAASVGLSSQISAGSNASQLAHLLQVQQQMQSLQSLQRLHSESSSALPFQRRGLAGMPRPPTYPQHLMSEHGRSASPDISRMLSMFSPAQVMDLLVAQQSCTPDQATRLMSRPGMQHLASTGRHPLEQLQQAQQRLTPLTSALRPPQHSLGDLGPHASYPLSPDYIRSQLLGSGAPQRPVRRWPGLHSADTPTPQPHHAPPADTHPHAHAEAQPARPSPAPVPHRMAHYPLSSSPLQDLAMPVQQGRVHVPQARQVPVQQVPSQGFRPPQEQAAKPVRDGERRELAQPAQPAGGPAALTALQQLLSRFQGEVGMSPEMLQQTLTQAAQQLQAQMQPTAQDTGGLKQASTKSKGPVLAVPAAQEAAAAQPKTGSELAEAAETLICLNALQSAAAGDQGAMASARASPAKAAHISPTNSKAPKARAQEQAQRSGSRGSGHRRSEAGARKRLHARSSAWRHPVLDFVVPRGKRSAAGQRSSSTRSSTTTPSSSAGAGKGSKQAKAGTGVAQPGTTPDKGKEAAPLQGLRTDPSSSPSARGSTSVSLSTADASPMIPQPGAQPWQHSQARQAGLPGLSKPVPHPALALQQGQLSGLLRQHFQALQDPGPRETRTPSPLGFGKGPPLHVAPRVREAPVPPAARPMLHSSSQRDRGEGRLAEATELPGSAAGLSQGPYRPNGPMMYKSRHEKFMGSMRAQSEQ